MEQIITKPELAQIKNKIYEIRGVKVMLDFDLAEIYGVETKVLNQSVKRNMDRFPLDFMFQITNQEFGEVLGIFLMLLQNTLRIFITF